ncbi:hypothetical protein [Sphingomonas sp.]|jgi:hypothetical protein|uniref:hypothetical protein n=1 Tax=Sphingomonas sp. TaxID=28214 RepID=UPI002ED7B7F8
MHARRAKRQAEAGKLIAEAQAVRSGYVPKPGQPSKADLDAMVEGMKNDLDSMSEMGEMESLRLQMAMDRLSKMMSTVSNLLKKISDTSETITQNLKIAASAGSRRVPTGRSGRGGGEVEWGAAAKGAAGGRNG